MGLLFVSQPKASRVNKKKILIVVGHPDKKSFCWNGIYKTAKTDEET